MMRRKEMKQLLEERAERIGLLEQRLETLEQLLDGYKARESSIVQTLANANDAAARRMQEAEAAADKLLADAGASADAAVRKAQADAEAALKAAQEDSARLMEQTQRSVQAYEDALAAYNANLERSAAEVQATAARYAAFIKERKIDAGELFNEIGGGAVTVNPAVADELSDPEGDPKTLMQNIYRLQNRDIPADIAVAPDDLIEEIIADLGPRPADVDVPAPEPEPESEMASEPEWQPEPEPEWQPEYEPESVPSVNDIVPDAPEEEVSLDALLEEIIAAGDI